MAILGIASLFCVIATGIVPNGNFENGRESWTLGDGESWHVENGAGRPHAPGQLPTAALVWERKPGDKKGGWIGTTMPVRTGAIYRITAWAAIDELSGGKKNPGFCVGIGTNEDHSRRSCEMRVRFDSAEEVDLDGWRKLSSVTPPIPADSNSLLISLIVDGDATGRVRFDDVVVEAVGERLIENPCCMVPGRSAAAGPVLFSATIHPDVSHYPLKTLRPKLKWGAKEKEMTLKGVDLVELDVDASEFEFGENAVIISLETSDGKVLATETIDFTRTEPNAGPCKTMFDAHKRLLVDGKPTYPLGIYWHYANNGDEEAYDLLGQTPFNFVVSYDKNIKDTSELDRFHKRGIGVISSVAHGYSWIPYRPEGVTDDASAVRHVERVVSMVKDHPAHWGWYIVDEPKMENLPSILEQYRRVKRLDPGHIGGAVTWTPNDARLLSQCADFFGVDSYPVGGLSVPEIEKTFPRMSEITRECKISYEQTKGRVPLWQVPQAFNWWDDYRRNPAYWWMRVPTREEFVSQAWQEIASGADGFCWFIFKTVYEEWKKGNRAMFYNLCAAMEDVRRLSPVLLSIEQPPSIKGADAGLSARAFFHEGKAYVVACNLGWKRRAATLALSGQWQKPWTEVGAPALIKDGNKLELDLPPIGVSVIRLDPAERQEGQPMATAFATSMDEPKACRPVARFVEAPWWTARLGQTRSKILSDKAACYDLVLVGDSITHRWEYKANGGEVYPSLLQKYKVLNLGNGGDKTQNVIWRLENNGELDNYAAKVFAVMIGVNNGGEDPEGTVAGVKKIVGLIREKHPESKVIVQAILPHGREPRNAISAKVINPMLKKYAEESGFVWLDIGEKFLDENGEIRQGLMMPDNLHPIKDGYEIWFTELSAVVDRLLGRR